ncbi:MAG: chemotaxis response regulator protein-glutamate methylesterase [Gammaproteobacteria bacterium HGW-Gammaproteobacteria-3]|nr:MAG: chemotaxis response regulator protein-glutamate methylesterase [Gammaproteobacteria bacterium HGW-Gammaproteobacteria-3]
MTINVLIVDDSAFICKRIKEILEQPAAGGSTEFKVVGVAANGLEAVRLAASLKPDVITMDIEMPVLDGISAVKRIMQASPAPILMFSSMTQVGAKATLDALEAGAVDFLPKQLNEIDNDREVAKLILRRRVRMVAQEAGKIKALSLPRSKEPKELGAAPVLKRNQPANPLAPIARGQLGVIAIAASTGGPVAIQRVLMRVPKNCPVPIIIVQHMPPNFTRSFAERLNQLCQINVREAQANDVLEPGLALLAPGGMQMEVQVANGHKKLVLRDKGGHELFSPSADITLASVARHFPGSALAVVLTGMGADGREGVREMKQAGAVIWAQSEASCTIYGMPKAIVDAGLADHVYSIDEIGNELARIS